VLVMTSTFRSATLIKDFLSTMDPSAPDGEKGRKMMEDRLRVYLWWKGKLGERKQESKARNAFPRAGQTQKDTFNWPPGEGMVLSEALKRKDKDKAQRSASRRRVRGGASPSAVPARNEVKVKVEDVDNLEQEAHNIAEL
jgi:DNA excision repair protein ERCC-4